MPSIRRSAAAVAVAALITFSAVGCGPSGDAPAALPPSADAATTATGAGGLKLPTALPTSIQDLDKWKQALRRGGWRNWDRAQWLRQARDFINPVVKGLWNPKRMGDADQSDKQVAGDVPGDAGQTDPQPAPVAAQAVGTPYSTHAPYVGKLFFDGPQGPMVCSATVVDDPAHPGKSNLVWTAGHCVHAGARGGWYRNIAFVPSYNDSGLSLARLRTASRAQVAPKGVWWADWAQTSSQWISSGSEEGGSGSPYDFAVLHVRPEQGAGGASLQETVGGAMPVWFDAPSATRIGDMGAWGYPAAPPFDGQRMYSCQGTPGRLSLDAAAPTEYRIGCTMTAGASGGGWFTRKPDGTLALVSNTSIGPAGTSTWLAGPHLGTVAEGVYEAVSRRFR